MVLALDLLWTRIEVCRAIAQSVALIEGLPGVRSALSSTSISAAMRLRDGRPTGVAAGKPCFCGRLFIREHAALTRCRPSSLIKTAASDIQHGHSPEHEHPRQCRDRDRPFPVALLSAVPAADVPGLAKCVRRVLRRAWPFHGADVVRDRAAADAGRVPRRSLRRAALSDRRHAAYDFEHSGSRLCDRILAGAPAVRPLRYG